MSWVADNLPFSLVTKGAYTKGIHRGLQSGGVQPILTGKEWWQEAVGRLLSVVRKPRETEAPASACSFLVMRPV